MVAEEKLFLRIAQLINFPYVDLRNKKIDHEVLEIIPFTVTENYQLVAFAKQGQELSVGLIDPYNFQAIEALEFLAKQKKIKMKYFFISPASYHEALNQYSTLDREVEEALAKMASEKKKEVSKKVEEKEDRSELAEVISQAPVSKIVSVIIKHGVEAGASDIHIEPVADKSRVRYRIDGVLHTSLILPEHIHSSIISRVKVLANLKLDETRIPQDGRITLNVEERLIDFRVSTLPLLGKEKAVLRILQSSIEVPSLKDLGFSDYYIKLIQENITRPHGLFLISGPTGSGKSTTLYSILNILNKEKVNIITLEDPIEFNLEGVNQSQTRPEVEYTFASGLRSILRQDPNIIMVGEIRDNQTAAMAVHASLTGHLIFSTVHTNDAFGVIPRLIDMQVEPFLLASTLNIVVAQRLTRKICPACKEKVEIPEYLFKKIKKELQNIDRQQLPADVRLDNLVFYQGKGCDACSNTGYHGRTSIAEILQITDEMKRLIVSGFNFREVKKEAENQKMLTLMQDGLLRALQGVTTVEEVLRVTQE